MRTVSNKNFLSKWILYKRGLEPVPECYICWRHDVVNGVDTPTRDMVTSNDLTFLRSAMMKFGLHKMERDPKDGPMIIETWI
jgi:hypothetical protein